MRTKIDFMNTKLGDIDIKSLSTDQVLDLLEVVLDLKESLEIRLSKDRHISHGMADLIRAIQMNYSEMLNITGFTPEGEHIAESLKEKLASKYRLVKCLDKMPKFKA